MRNFILRLLGGFLFLLGLCSLPFLVNSPIYLIFAGLFFYWGFCVIGGTLPRTGSSHTGGSGDRDYGGSDCTTYTGSDMPVGAHTDRGYVSFTDWSTNWDGSLTNHFTGETVKKDFYGNYRFEDDDSYSSSFYHSDHYGNYSMEYDD